MEIYNSNSAIISHMDDTNKTLEDLTDEDREDIYLSDVTNWELAEDIIDDIDKQADTFIIFGSMGLWNGKHEILPEKETYLRSLIGRIMDGKDAINISLVDGHIEFSGVHHDGTNSYNIYGVTQEGEEIFEKCWVEDDMEELAFHPEFEEIKDLSKRDQQKKFWEIFMNPENEFVVKLKAEF